MKKILIVDDELDVAEYLATALADQGYEVATASSSGDGLALLEAQRPDLLCLDLLMPDRSGLSLYREVRASGRLSSIPVLIVSGLGLEAELEQLLEGLRPPESYLEKPVDIAALVAEVERLAGPAGEA